jgi:hypothetical protein
MGLGEWVVGGVGVECEKGEVNRGERKEGK